MSCRTSPLSCSLLALLGAFGPLAIAQTHGLATWGDERVYPAATIWEGAPLSLDAGYSHVVAVQHDGKVVAWGENSYGEATVPGGMGAAVSVAAGAYHSVALLRDGTVRAWGNNEEGQASVPTGVTDVVEVCAGANYSAARRSDGSVIAWGGNHAGQASVPTSLPSVVQIDCGYYHVLALATDGRVVGWGDQSVGQTTPPPDLSDVVEIQAGQNTSFALRSDGTIVSWGYGGSAVGQVPPLSTVKQMKVGGWDRHGAAIMDNGDLLTWGYDPTDPDQSGASWQPGLRDAVALAVGYDFVVVARADGGVFVLGSRSAIRDSVPPGASGVQSIAGGGGDPATQGYFAAVTGSGRVAVWGGHPIDSDPNSPDLSTPDGMKDVSEVAIGYRHVLALHTDRSVSAWGANEGGQTDVPSGLNDVVQVAAQEGYSMALRANGTVSVWGGYGDGSPGPYANVPSDLTDAVQISAGLMHALALKGDGTVVSWGENPYGQTDVPPTLSDVIQVAAGGTFSLALRADGNVVVWGQTYHNSGDTPRIPAEASGLVEIATSGQLTIGRKADGTVVAWFPSGQELTVPSTITTPDGVANVSAVASSGSAVMALMGPRVVTASEPVVLRAGRSLAAPFPNPAQSAVQISYTLDFASPILLDVVDMQGRQMAALVSNEYRPAGQASETWNASGVAPGVYFIRLRTPSYVETRRVVVVD